MPETAEPARQPGARTIWANPAELIRLTQPDDPVMLFAPTVLEATARRFIAGFPGLVTYAVKSNPDPAVLRVLSSAGITGFDVASATEIDLIGDLLPGAMRHYHNPVRATAEIAHGVARGIRAWSVDSQSELEKLFAQLPTATEAGPVEISPRFTLPVMGAVYDFGSKFGATPERAASMLRAVADRGYQASLTFHPGTQCTDAAAWESYIATANEICDMAGCQAVRLNVGGGFPSHRVHAVAPELESIFDRIREAADAAFGGTPPDLVCEPGRALCADAFALVTRIKAIRDGEGVFLNDGVYGALMELAFVGNLDRLELIAPNGQPRQGEPRARVIFGPTCDSVDRLPGELMLPADIAEGDYVVFHGAGAYSTATSTRFNGFGDLGRATVLSLS